MNEFIPNPDSIVTHGGIVYSIHDAGRREDGFLREHRDCTVRAIAVATGWGYTLAHRFMKARGRKDGNGAYMQKILPFTVGDYIDHDGVRIRLIAGYKKKQTLISVIRGIETRGAGRYIIRKRGHCAAMVFTGAQFVVHDLTHALMPRMSRIDLVWSVEMIEQ